MDWSGEVDRKGWQCLLPSFPSLVALSMTLPSISYLVFKSKLLMSGILVWRGFTWRQAEYQALSHLRPANLN